MKCSCCGRKKRLMESFENLGDGGNVCVDCSDIIYKIHDGVTEKKKDIYETSVKSINKYIDKKQASKEFAEWFKNNFMKRNEFESK